MGEMIRVLLADDHAVLRSGLKALIDLEPDLEVVGEASNGREAVELVRSLSPDVVVMDISMPGMDGLAAAKALRASEFSGHIVMLTMHSGEEHLSQALKAGASGYVLKSSADKELMDAVRAAHRGQVFLYPAAVQQVLAEYLRDAKGEGTMRKYTALTERERDVLQRTAKGFTNQEIAQALVISPKTVDTYRQRIMEKLDLHHRSELVRYALKTGLLTVEE